MKQYTVTAEFVVNANNADEAQRKVHAMIFARDPLPPFDLPPAPALVAQASGAGNEQPELPWAPKGPGCTALL